MVMVFAIPAACRLHLIIRYDTWVPDMRECTGGLFYVQFGSSTWPPPGMRAPLVRLTPATKSGSQYLASWTRRCTDVTVAARSSLVFGDRPSSMVMEDAVSRPVGPRRKWRLMNATRPARLCRIDGKVMRPLGLACQIWSVYSTFLLRAECCVLHAHRTSAVLCMVSSPELPASGPARPVDAVATGTVPGQAVHRIVLSLAMVAQVQSSGDDSHQHQTRVLLWEYGYST